MTKELKKESKVDLYLSKLEEKVLIAYESGSKDVVVKIPTDFTKDEVKEIMLGVRNFELFRKLTYAKTHLNVAIELCFNEFYLAIRWK